MLWLILQCLNCDVNGAQRAQWSAEIVLQEPDRSYSWRHVDDRTFASRRECMRTIRREMPETDFTEPDAYGQINSVTHEPDHISRFEAIPYHMNAIVNRGCFFIERPTS